jgi:hypothetical protein
MGGGSWLDDDDEGGGVVERCDVITMGMFVCFVCMRVSVSVSVSMGPYIQLSVPMIVYNED